jgi:hypothetical protein
MKEGLAGLEVGDILTSFELEEDNVDKSMSLNVLLRLEKFGLSPAKSDDSLLCENSKNKLTNPLKTGLRYSSGDLG